MTGPRFAPLKHLPFATLLALLGATGPAVPARADEEPAKPEPAVAQVPNRRGADEIHGLLNLGASLTNRGDYGAAEIAYRQVLNARNTAPVDVKSALLGLAHMHRRQGVLTKAVAIYETFLKEFPGDERTPDALLDLGRTLRDMGAYKLAINRFYSVINSTLKLPAGSFDRYQQLAKTAQFEIAETHFQAGEYEEAAKFFSRLKLLDLAPADQARAQFKAAYSLNLLGDNEAAITALRAYLVQNPQDENVPEARYLLAVSLRALQRPEDAFAVTLELLNAEKSLIGTDPKRWAYWQGRTGNQLANDFFQSGDTTHAAAIYAGLVELSPDPAWRLPIIYQVALCQERLGNLDRARDSYHAIIDGAGKTPTPDLAELARMAAWRLDHLDWTDQIGRKVARIFESTTGTAAIAPPPPAPTLALP